MKFKKLMILAIFLIAILSIGAASAVNQTDDSISSENNLVELSQDDDSILESDSNEDILNSTSTVTPDNFFDYFDENGDAVTDDDLTFEGEFNSPVSHVTISSKNINGQNAVFKNMGIHLADDVNINGLTLISNQYVDNEGNALIYASGSGIVLKNIVLNYACDGGQNVYGIYFNDCHNFELSNSQITFEGNNQEEFYEYAVKMVDCGQGSIHDSTIYASLPLLDVDFSNPGLDADLALCMGIASCEDILIKGNQINTVVNAFVGSYPTLDTIMVVDSRNVTISSNNISEKDEFTPEGTANYLNVVDFYTTNDVLIELNNISVTTVGGSENSGTSYPIQLSGPYSNVVVNRNRLYANCKGPVLGVYSQSYYGGTEILVQNNFINVTGLPTFNEWGLVSGIELQDYIAKIYNNTIYTQAIDGTYEDGKNLFGISYAQNLPSAENNYDIRDNTIYTEGKYGVYLLKAMNSNITNNVVYSGFAEGDEAVYIGEGENNNVSDNNLVIDTPENLVTPENFFDFFEEDGYLKDEFDELIFEGEFDNIVDSIQIFRTVSFIGNGAVFNNIALNIYADDVILDNIRMTADKSFDDGLMYLSGVGILIHNLDIDYRVQDEFAVVINAIECQNLNILNNHINFESHVSSDENSAMVINLLDCQDVVVDNNIILSSLPALPADTRDEDYFMMGLITVSPIKIKQTDDLIFTNNILNSTTNEIRGLFPTIQAVFVVGSENVLFDGNKFRVLDELSPLGQDSYLYGINFGYNKNITVKNNDFNISTPGGKDSAGTAYALEGMKSDIKIIGNNITSRSNGPNIGIYVTSMTGEGADEYIANNFINITGLATNSGNWALVTGIEIQNGYAKIYNNTIYTYNVGAYNESNYCYGISYAQWMYGNRTLDIQDNTVVTEGKYTISTIATKETETTPILIKNNSLTAHELVGNASIELKGINSTLPDENPISNETVENVTSNMTINVDNAWIGADNMATVSIPNAAGTVTFIINGKTYTAQLNDGVATVTLAAGDLVLGENTLTVNYNNLNNSTSFKVLDGIVTSENVLDYFNQSNNGKLVDCVPEGATLDFQGEIKSSDVGEFNIYINKAVNMVSSTKDALIDLNTTAGDMMGSNPGNRFTIDKQGSRTNVTGIVFHNTQVWVYNADYVTLDNISVIVEDQRVGSGVGATSIRQNSSYVTVKNSYFYTRNNGGSSSLVIAWANYCNFDNNTVVAEGNVGNAIYITTYNVEIPSGAVANVYNNVTNNRVRISPMSAGICNGITFSGSHNLIENNTIFYSAGMGITSQNGLTVSSDNIFRYNNITGGASMEVLPDSVVYNNYVSGSLRLLSNDVAYNNTILKGLSIAGDNVRAYDNIINGALTINAVEGCQITNSNITGDVSIEKNGYNNTLSHNNITGIVSIKGYENIVKNNYISSNQQYSVQMTQSYATGNIVSGNTIYSSKFIGNEAVQDKNSKNNVFDNLPLTTELTVKVDSIKVGQDAIVQIWINKNANGSVKVKFNNVESVVSMNNGFGTFKISDLLEGSYKVDVTFSGDAVYSAKTESKTFTVSKNDLSLDNVIVDVPDRGNPSFTVDLGSNVTGTLTVTVNNEDYSTTIENGQATVTVEGLDAGSYSATVRYSGDNKYNSVSKNVEFIVKADPAISVIADNIHVGDVLKINVSADSRIRNVIVVLNGEHSLDLTNGEGSLPISGLSAGNYTITVIFNGNSELLNKSIERAFEVSKMDLSDDAITMDNDFKSPEFAIDLNGDATGTLTVTVGKNYSESISNGKATVTISDLTPGIHDAVVTYSGDDKYNSLSKEFNFIIKAEPSIAIDVKDIFVGDVAYINISADERIDSVIIDLNGEKTVVLTGGKGNISILDLSAGKYTVKVKFNGNDYLFAKEVSAEMTVSKYEIADDAFAVDGNNFEINLPSDATGTFDVKVGNKNYSSSINNGKAIVVVDETPGTYDVVMTYSGDSKYVNASKTTQLIVPKWESTISANVSDIHIGDEAVFDVEVNAGATGSVTIIIDGKEYNGIISNAKVQINVPNLANGTYEAIVKYNGDDNYLANETVKSFKVSKVDIIGEWFVVGESISITLPGDANGNVIVTTPVKEFTEEIVNGKAIVGIDLTPGNYGATVTYSGDDKYNGISGNAQIEIPKYVSPISANAADVLVGETVKITVSVPQQATGKISVIVNGDSYNGTVENGKAIVEIAGLELGNYTAEVNYIGDNNYSANQTSVKFNVSKILVPDADQVISIPDSSSSAPSYSIDLPDATGNLTVYVDGKVYKSVELVDGKATIDVKDLASGNHDISVVYSGDSRYTPISKQIKINVPETHVPVVKLSGLNVVMLYTSGAKYQVRLTSDGVALAGKTVVFTINGKTVRAVTNKNGYASVKINLPPRTAKYALTATYNGVKISNKVKVNGIVTAKNVKVKKSAKSLKIKVTLKKVNGKYIKSKWVSLKFKGKVYKVKTNKKGVATFKIPKKVIKKLKAGKKYTYKATYLKQTVSKKVTVKK